ncbi:hypothetical protein ACRAWD_07275, partial [Caulobacter segnis]
MKVGVQGVNLLNETTRTTQILDSNLLKTGRSWFVNDRRYTVVLRAASSRTDRLGRARAGPDQRAPF